MAENLNPLEFLKGLSLSRGAMLGAAATIPMTAFMLAGASLLAKQQTTGLPAKAIVDDVLGRVHAGITGQGNLDLQVEKGKKLSTALTSQFAYGASMGSLYSGVAGRWPLSKMPGFLKGGLFGVGVWAASYPGWVPGLKLALPETEDLPQRNILLAAAHVVWGLTLGLLDERF